MNIRSVAGVAIALLVVGSIPAGAAEKIVCTPSGPNTTVCKITEPNVTVATEPFNQITYMPGDDVTVDAGGCVQTGGHGRTWKLYVNPQGPNSDKLYHGLIFVPGASNAMERIGQNHRVFHVSPVANPKTLFVRLGYEDDNYKDNGYWGHDDGTGDQCKNVGNAFVTVTIVHHTVAVTPTPVKPLPLDPVKAAFDDNGMLFTPTWAYESGGVLKSTSELCPNGIPKCTHETVGFDSPSFPKTPGFCNGSGHFNWSTATFAGKVFWDSHSGTDDDYNMWLLGTTKFSMPLTKDNDGPPGHFEGVHLEYDSDETIDNYTSTWWNGFHQAVDDSDAKARAKVDNADTVAVGLLGLDCVHDCLTEIHPVLALAMRVNDHPAGVDRWSFFARNHGDEGFCSENQHHLPVNPVVMRLHSPSSVLHHFTLVGSDFRRNDKGVSFTVDHDGDDAILIITVPPGENEAHGDGSIDLKWTQ
jgi:hypothetical protein